jgi:hypothetical protein
MPWSLGSSRKMSRCSHCFLTRWQLCAFPTGRVVMRAFPPFLATSRIHSLPDPPIRCLAMCQLHLISLPSSPAKIPHRLATTYECSHNISHCCGQHTTMMPTRRWTGSRKGGGAVGGIGFDGGFSVGNPPGLLENRSSRHERPHHPRGDRCGPCRPRHGDLPR